MLGDGEGLRRALVIGLEKRKAATSRGGSGVPQVFICLAAQPGLPGKARHLQIPPARDILVLVINVAVFYGSRLSGRAGDSGALPRRHD